jgi:hypothetical protein
MPLATVLTEEDIERMCEIYQRNDRSLRLLAYGFGIREDRCKKILTERGVYNGQARQKIIRQQWAGSKKKPNYYTE